ncbi:hypothetical protein AB8945_22135, partial [Yersinia enterocolitica]
MADLAQRFPGGFVSGDSEQERVMLTAGENLTVQGSEVLAGKDISLSGKNVAILAAENQSS